MGKLVFNKDKILDFENFAKICPFGAIEKVNGEIIANASCKMCRLCIKKSTNGEAEFIEEETVSQDISEYKDVCILVDQTDGIIHPVTFELIGKGRELADKSGCKLKCLIIGEDVTSLADTLLYYPVDEIYVYDHKELKFYRAKPYVNTMEDFVNKVKPAIILVGATTVGRQFAPRSAARFKTGLTADCTVLDIIPENCELVQIRPAFGGNIMAEIHTPKNRPQMATVRYKVMQAPKKLKEKYDGKIIVCDTLDIDVACDVEVLSLEKKPKIKNIESANILVVAGRGVKTKEDLKMIEDLALSLGGELAGTRPMIESGWLDANRQIGLSGRTVRPELIITCGVSGAVQFTAGMRGAERIFAINKDEKAPIFEVAHYGVVGDIYEIVPKLTQLINSAKEKENV